jgi:hypothetical protein
MYWREVPYRIMSVLRGLAQSRGLFSASAVPAEALDATWGNAWCQAPVALPCATALRDAARDIVAGKLSVFGQQVPMREGVPDWNTDPVTSTRIGSTFGLFIDFRHVGEGVDIKHLWEINRHVWWVPLAQCYAQTHETIYLERLRSLLSSWLDACPYPLGPNWSSPVEHGIRLINWSIIWHLIGGAASPIFEGAAGERLLRRWLDSIYQHIRFASDNYSLYSSADNHLIGEAAAVFVAAHTWDRWAETRRLRSEAKAILEREVLLQFSADGVCLEQATCYHKFSLQFLLACGLCGRANGDDFSDSFWSRIEAAMTFTASMMDCTGKVPQIGDADDGEVWRLGHGADFNSYASLLALGAILFERADLQAKVESVTEAADQQVPWLLRDSAPVGDRASLRSLPTSFPQGGYVVMGDALHEAHEFRVTMDCGPLGSNRVAGHGHADALAVLVSWEGEPLLVDPGTYCYNAAPKYRHFFRGTHAHNTLVVDGLDQSEYGASFLWLRDVNCELRNATNGKPSSIHASHDGYRRLADPVTHHRQVTLDPSDGSLIVEDWLECTQEHCVELLWHAAPGARLLRCGSGESWQLQGTQHVLQLSIDGTAIECSVAEACESPTQGWFSSRFYERVPAPVLVVRGRLIPRQVLRTIIRRGREATGDTSLRIQ